MTHAHAVAMHLAPHMPAVRAAWPRLAVADDLFTAFVAERAASADAEIVAALPLADLYLACACARKDPQAIEAFEARYASELRATHARMRDAPLDADETLQRIRQKLFLDAPPGIAGYAGRGSLLAWLRVITTRVLLNARERETKERAASGDFFDAMVAGDDGAELALLKKSIAQELRVALLGALEALTNREKSLLRYAYCDARSVDDIAMVFRVHRATAARWVVKARERLVEETHARLREQLGASQSEIGSVVRLGIGIIDTTFAKHLAPERSL